MLANKPLLLIGQWALVAIIALAFAMAVCKPIVLTASDMGRHLTNGRIFLDSGEIATTNLYSFTHPNFPFLNHHWGSGVFFELARRFRGFVGVSMFGLCLVITTVFLHLRIAWKHGSYWLALTAAFLVLPIFASRAEIRPEHFSYLFMGLFLWILMGVRGRTMPPWALAALPVLMLAWVNLHIYFFLGICWIGAFFLDALLRAWREPSERAEHLRLAAYVFGALVLSCLVTPFNPNGWQGAVYPLFIFQNYAYAVAENQTVFAIERNGAYPPGLYVRIAWAVLFISWIWRLWRDKQTERMPDWALLILSIFVAFLSWKAIRNFTIFSYVTMIAISFSWSDIDVRAQLGRWTAAARWASPAAVLAIMIAIHPGYWHSVYRTFGLGVAPNILRSLAFFKENELRGPIFNNYDIGGFLTYGLYPEERVFVDNRPEAYPGEFFTQVLLPMQLKEEDWMRFNAQYGFNVIYFYRHDATRWGQAFMARRIQDPAWAPIFVDGYVIIFARRIPDFKEVIAQYELPKSNFEIVPRNRNQ